MTFFCMEVDEMTFIFVIVCVASREGAVGCVEDSVLGLVVLVGGWEEAGAGADFAGRWEDGLCFL